MTNYTISVSKADELYDIDFDSLPAASQSFIIAYGLRQYLNDAVAGVKPEDGTKAAKDKVDARMTQLTSGTVGERASVERNPVKTIMAQLARQQVKAALKAKGKKASKEQIAAFVTKLIERDHDKLEAKAKAMLAEVKDIPAVDLDDLE